MLTIRKPIALRTQNPIQSIRQDMAERIQANYGLMKLPIRKEELLHITAEPPEIYFAEGDQFTLSTNINNAIQQEMRLDVINNLINRIMVAQTDNFSYQDTVYISSILRKLGIRDEKQFMKQVFALQNEKTESQRLLEKYEENREMLMLLFEREEAKQAETPAAAASVTTEQRYYLHDEVFKRLETSKIYQDMRSYSKGIRHESQQIFRAEMSIGEQAAMVQQFHLQQVRQQILGNTMPLYYLRNNSYEFLQEMTEEISQTLEEQISAAILLNLTDQSFALRQQQIEKNNHNWYSLAGALFQTSENTWKRYETNLTEGRQVSQQLMQAVTEVSHAKHIEGDAIEHISAEYRELYEQWQDNTVSYQQLIQQKAAETGGREDVALGGGSFHLTEEELNLTYLQQQEETEQEEKAPEAITVEQLQKHLEVFRQKNLENYQRLTEIDQQQPRIRDRKLDRRKAQQDALRALEQPGEVLMEFLTTEVVNPVEEVQREAGSKIYELLSEETKEIYRQFLQQTGGGETTFLQHIMTQPVENEVRQEVLRVVEQMQRQEFETQIRQEKETVTEVVKPVISQSVREELQQRLTHLQQQQETVYQNWIQPTELYWQKETEKEREELHQIERVQKETQLRQERILQAAEDAPEKAALEKETLLHPSETEDVTEIFTETEKNVVLTRQENKLAELKETIQKEMKRQQQEHRTETAETRKELQFRQVELVHKAEEQINEEELLETIRQQQHRLKKEDRFEENTLQKNTITQQTVQQTIQQSTVERIEEIDEMIQQNVKKQINQLSDQVYSKIEKKLQTERKRRGFS